MKLCVIAAVTSDLGLGANGQLLYHISADLRRFKELTMGHPIIMGRRTFESFPKGALPGRRNMVVTRQTSYTAPGIETFPSLEAAVEAAATADKAFIIGGGEIYAQALEMADELDLTVIDAERPDADTRFPDIDPDVWQATSETEPLRDEKAGVDYRFVCFSRR